MKNILQIAADMAPHLGIDVPDAVFSSTDPTTVDVLRCINEAGVELATRFDWPQLRKLYTISLAGNVPHNLPTDYSRMVRGASVSVNGVFVRGSVSDEEFNRLSPVAGAPRYYRASPTAIEFWPYASAPDEAKLIYISRNWLAGNKDAVDSDSNQPVIEDELVRKGALVRFKRMKGHDFTDFLEEYEGDLVRYSTFSRSERSP